MGILREEPQRGRVPRRCSSICSTIHPPSALITRKSRDGALYLVHRFEEKPLVQEFIANTMLGIEFLWGGSVRLETSDVVPPPPLEKGGAVTGKEEELVYWRRVVYTMENRQLTKTNL